MDRIAQHDQYLSAAKESLKPERTFIVFTYPSEGEPGEPEIYVSAHSQEVEWAIGKLIESLWIGEVQAGVERLRELLGDDESTE
jgi:hypothetical protein